MRPGVTRGRSGLALCWLTEASLGTEEEEDCHADVFYELPLFACITDTCVELLFDI
jgi:hypothetical protein